MTTSKQIITATTILTISCLATLPVKGEAVFDFENITGTSATDVLIGETQLKMDASDPGGNQVLFTFSNSGPEASVITDIYFDDGTLLGIATIFNNPPNVVFSHGASPPNLPGGNLVDPDFETTVGFLGDADPAPPHKGVGPGESVGILFDLKAGGTFANVLTELADATLRVGIHVQAFEDGESESFVNIVPEPTTGAIFLLTALVGLAHRGKRTKANIGIGH